MHRSGIVFTVTIDKSSECTEVALSSQQHLQNAKVGHIALAEKGGEEESSTKLEIVACVGHHFAGRKSINQDVFIIKL